jgi:hypothetical protein
MRKEVVGASTELLLWHLPGDTEEYDENNSQSQSQGYFTTGGLPPIS